MEQEKLYIQVYIFDILIKDMLVVLCSIYIYIQSGQCGVLKISAGVTKLGSYSDKLHICIANNPHVDTIEVMTPLHCLLKIWRYRVV